MHTHTQMYMHIYTQKAAQERPPSGSAVEAHWHHTGEGRGEKLVGVVKSNQSTNE